MKYHFHMSYQILSKNKVLLNRKPTTVRVMIESRRKEIQG